MTDDIVLSPSELGAELLTRLAKERFTGAVAWTVAERTYKLAFAGGRPEVLIAADGKRVLDRDKVVQTLRAMAVATLGRLRLQREDVEVGASLGLDTLGEALLALVHGLRDEQVEDVLAARGDRVVRATPQFERLARAITGLKGASISAPEGSSVVSYLAMGLDRPAQRALIALLALGGFEDAPVVVTQTPAAAITAPSPAVAPAPAPEPAAPKQPNLVPKTTTTTVQYPILPSDKRAMELALEIKSAHKAASKQNYYEVLGVAASATAEQVRKAYFEQAKRWHTDRFAGIPMGEYAKYADELFHVVDEAQKTLCDPQKRSEYDFVLDRRSKGLPTDVGVILEAEAMFKRAQGMVRRGDAKLAEPLLRQAVELNKGEAEFWIYYGYAIYAARGKEAVVEARAKIKQGLEMKAQSDVAYEFLGKIARTENELDVARRHLDKALELNPKNAEAERELRFVTMRTSRAKQGGSGGGLLSKLFKK